MKKLLSIIMLMLVVLSGQAQNVNTIADTYWRNEATGEWFIGFAAKHVIYNNEIYVRGLSKTPQEICNLLNQRISK